MAPLQGPIGLTLDAGDGIDSMQQLQLFLGVLHVRIDQQAVRFGMDILDGDLESIETPCLGTLDFGHKVLCQIFIDDTIRRGEEREYVLDEMTFIVIEFRPIGHITTQIDFFCRPKGRLRLLVHTPKLHNPESKINNNR